MLAHIGRTGKPHGINGELNLLLDEEFVDCGLTPDNLRCVVMDIDGINVPFFIERWRAKNGDNILVKIDGVDNEIAAKELSNKSVSALAEEVADMTRSDREDGLYATDMIGYNVVDNGLTVGEIVDIEDSTDNALFIVRRPDSDKPLYIPIADSLISMIDTDNHTVGMDLPDGLLNL